jgi:hypothetical protein
MLAWIRGCTVNVVDFYQLILVGTRFANAWQNIIYFYFQIVLGEKT